MFGNAGARATEILTATEKESATLSMRAEHSAMWTGDLLFVDLFLCGQGLDRSLFHFCFVDNGFLKTICGQLFVLACFWTGSYSL